MAVATFGANHSFTPFCISFLPINPAPDPNISHASGSVPAPFIKSPSCPVSSNPFQPRSFALCTAASSSGSTVPLNLISTNGLESSTPGESKLGVALNIFQRSKALALSASVLKAKFCNNSLPKPKERLFTTKFQSAKSSSIRCFMSLPAPLNSLPVSNLYFSFSNCTYF